MGVFPILAYLGGRWLSEISDGKAARVLALSVTIVAVNWLGWIPLKAAALIAAPLEPVQSVSGMMRRRLRDVRPRSDLARFVGELIRGPEGYIEPAAAAIKAGGGGTLFSDADNLSLMFAAGTAPIYPDELTDRKPDWILPSPWLRLEPRTESAVMALIADGYYEAVPLTAPRLLWQNNPDPLFRDFGPQAGPRPFFRRHR